MSNKVEFKTFYQVHTKEDIEKVLDNLRKRLELDLELKEPDILDKSFLPSIWHSYLGIVVEIKEIQDSKSIENNDKLLIQAGLDFISKDERDYNESQRKRAIELLKFFQLEDE